MKISVLELATIREEQSTTEAIQCAIDGAKVVDELGYHRIWYAEHHNMQHIASSATSILIGHTAAQTKNIRVGSGGIMMPNHTPLLIAEQFGTLASIYPNRIDLGLGRAPGTDQATAMALRKHNFHAQHNFKQDILELKRYFSNANSHAPVRAFPGEGIDMPIYILGSSTDSAYLAAALGLPYAFAAHFAPAMLAQASEIYHQNYTPSPEHPEPYFIVCVNIIAADTVIEAEHLATSVLNMFAGIFTNNRIPLAPPTSKPLYTGIPELEKAVQSMLSCTFMTTKELLPRQITEFASTYHAKEIMTTNYIYDIEKRHYAFKLIAEALQ